MLYSKLNQIMKKLLLSVSLLTAASFAFGQITSADFGSVGDSYQLGLDATPGVSLGSTGAGQTWNYTTLNTETLDTLFFVDPATLPNAGDFPSSNIATVSNEGIFYLEKNVNYIRNHGLVAGVGPFAAVANYVPGLDIIQFPASLGTSFSTSAGVSEKIYIGIDTNIFGCQIVVDSIWVKRTSVFDVDFDASGTLQLPTDTFNNALRSYSEERSVDSIFIYAPNAVNCVFPPVAIPQGWSFADPSLVAFAGFGSNPSFDTTRIYTWYAPGEDFSVCAIDVNSANSPVSARFKSDYAHFTVGINEPFTVETTLYPNPANDFIRITSEEPLAGTTVSMYDINGRIVARQIMNEQGNVNTSALEQGVYLYMIHDQQNKPVSKGRFVISR